MKRKATYRLRVTRREMLYVGDEFDHTLMLTEMEGIPVQYDVGAAGEFVSRRSVGFHDRTKGSGPMMGYAVTQFQEGAVFNRYEGNRNARTKLTTGTWKTYKGTGKLRNLKGEGNFTVKPGEKHDEFILEIEGEYEM